MTEKRNDYGRRRFFKTAAGITSVPLVAPFVRTAGGPQRDNPIVAENQLEGTVEWQLQYTRFDDPITLASYPLIRRLRSSSIEGYVSKTSLLPGEQLDFMVSMDPPGQFHLDLYRMGYYGGRGGRHFLKLGPFPAESQPIPMMTTERLRECRWEKCTTFTIPDDWPSGVYLGKLTRDENFGAQSYVIFVVKEHRKSDILFQVSDLTWQAYNKWPGNDSLYDDGAPSVWYTGPNVRVSFDRPYAKYCQIIDAPLSAGSGEFLLWEHPMVYWLEREGYDVTYCSNLDLELDPQVLDLSKVFISIGHDEYWSREMYNQAMRARDEGLSMVFLSGNSVYHEILTYESTVTGAPFRAFARKHLYEDEANLMGSTSYGSGYGDWVVQNSGHWIYESTGLRNGDRIPAIIGWEYHGPPYGEIDGLEVVAESQVTDPDNRHGAVVFPGQRGNWVFNAGTIWWAEGLAQPPGHIPARTPNRAGTFGVNPHVETITRNFLDRTIRESPRG